MSPRENAIGTISRVPRKLGLPGRASATLTVALGLFVVAAIVLAANVTLQGDSFGWVEHTNEVLRTVSAIERNILEADSGERGYLLTGEASYLDSYNRSQANIPRLLDTARQQVADTGCGISREIAAQLFKPFVTTKRQGMGIGLSISRTIIESHGGQIAVEPNPGGGTIFSFTVRGVVPEELTDDQ